MFRGELLKIIFILLAISLLMALNGFSAKQLVVLTLLTKTKDGTDDFVSVQKEIRGSGRIQLYENALRALKENRIPENEVYTTAFSKAYKVNYVIRDVNTVIVDFSSSRLVGSLKQEQLLIGQVVRTLTQSFAEVESVLFTVDGERAETLMGHVDIQQPFTSVNIDMH